ncbi:hypothetical protein HanXRQr2_Chr08g0360041 [Helianthus annuus]|uniref:Uncharacterized protein n=1 Tax=Helianthus annuus TaxID=4232 RepID=A0A9K3IIQ6_HELAN|nr:hypothetical protein HanXRQr2_Chr08g0360041 [Helianthus annuus]
MAYARRRKKAQVTRRHKYLKIAVNPQLRRLGEMERAHDQNMSYQALPLAYANVLGQNTFCTNCW